MCGPRFDPGVQCGIGEEEVDGVGDDWVVDIEEDDEVFLRFLYQVLHLFLKSTDKTVVHLHLWALSPT